MADVINLRTACKVRDRAAKEQAAAAKRALHGRTKAERQRDADARARHEALLDGAEREP